MCHKLQLALELFCILLLGLQKSLVWVHVGYPHCAREGSLTFFFFVSGGHGGDDGHGDGDHDAHDVSKRLQLCGDCEPDDVRREHNPLTLKLQPPQSELPHGVCVRVLDRLSPHVSHTEQKQRHQEHPLPPGVHAVCVCAPPPEGNATAAYVAPLGTSRQTRCSGTVKPLHSRSHYYYTAVLELRRAKPSTATGCNQNQLLASWAHLRIHILVTVGHDDDGCDDDVHGDGDRGDGATSWPEL
jgi:hypothetical protein